MQIKKKAITILMTACLVLFLGPDIRAAAEPVGDDSAANAGFVVDEEGTLVDYTGAGGAITIPANVQTIGAGAFASDKAVTSVTIPSSVTGMGDKAFYDCTSLTSVTIEGSMNAIPTQAFYNCTSLTAIAIPSSVTSIGSQAFGGCASLTGITIPSSVNAIGADAFTGCSRLTGFAVESDNGAYAVSDGCLYNKVMTKLIRCPQGKSNVTIAGSTVTIASGAFTDCIAVASLTLPESVTAIETNAFSGSGIDTILIPASVNSIGSQSYWNPSAISGYSGSQAQVYATGNGIEFQSIGTVETPGGTNNGGNTQTPDASGNGTDVGASGGTSGNGTNTGTSGGASGKTTTSDNHEKDVTPQTGDGLNPAYFLCFGVLLIGVYFILAGKRRHIG